MRRPPTVSAAGRYAHQVRHPAAVAPYRQQDRAGYATGAKHSNTAENFCSIFKRGVIGTYHHMSEAHLSRYCAEFDLRYNTREMNDGERAALIIKGGEGRRLTYRRTNKLTA